MYDLRRKNLDQMDFSDVVDASALPIPPTHPDDILLEEFMKPLAITQYQMAKTMRVPSIRISQIIHGKRAITADTALRLAVALGTTAEFWLAIQNQYDLESAKASIHDLETIRPLSGAVTNFRHSPEGRNPGPVVEMPGF